MTSIHDRLVSAMGTFLSASEGGAIFDDFASDWQSLCTDIQEQSADLPEDETDFAHSIAGAISAMCESLMEVSLADAEAKDWLEDKHEAVKAHHISHTPSRVVEAPSVTPFLTPPSSRESSPTRFPSLSRHTPSPPPSPLQALNTAKDFPSGLPSPALTEEHSNERSGSPLSDAIGGQHSADAIEPHTVASLDPEKDATVAAANDDAFSTATHRTTSPSVEETDDFAGALKPKQSTSITPAFIRPLLTHIVEKPYNLYPSKTLISEIALSTGTSEKDINAYLGQLRSRLGWNGIRKKYFPPMQWSINQMLAWLDGYWEYTHSELPSLQDYDVYMGATGIGGTMRGLDVRLTILHDRLKGLYDRMTGRDGEGSDVGKAIKEGVKWSSKHEWEQKRKEFEKQGEALRKAQREEESSHKRKFVEDEDYDGEEVARQMPRARVVSAPQPQSKKRGRSESPESEDDGDLTPPPPAKRHCSLPTMSLSTPTNLENWFKVQAPLPTWDAPVTLKAFSYDAMPMPSLVDDDSDSERGSSVGPSTPDPSEYVDLPAFDFSTLVQPMEYGGMPKPFELNVHTLPDVAFPELINAQSLNMDLFAAAPKDLPSSNQFISIPTSDEAPFDFGDPQSWSFNYESFDLGSVGFDLNFGVDGV